MNCLRSILLVLVVVSLLLFEGCTKSQCKTYRCFGFNAAIHLVKPGDSIYVFVYEWKDLRDSENYYTAMGFNIDTINGGYYADASYQDGHCGNLNPYGSPYSDSCVRSD